MPSPPNRALILPYAAPYLAYVAIVGAAPRWFSREVGYGLSLLVVPLLLAWAWRWYVPLRGPKSAAGSVGIGVVAGAAGCAAWILLLAPFAPPGKASWGAATFGLRVLAAGLVVPVFEELFTRGFVLRLAYQWDRARRRGEPQPLLYALDDRSVDEVPPGAWTLGAVAVSTVVFAAGHQVYEWPAAFAFGALMAGLWIFRRDLLSCVVAHGTANVVLAAYVWTTGHWGLW